MKRIPKQEYTAQFKDQAVAMVKGGKTVAEAARNGAGGADPAQLGQARARMGSPISRRCVNSEGYPVARASAPGLNLCPAPQSRLNAPWFSLAWLRYPVACDQDAPVTHQVQGGSVLRVERPWRDPPPQKTPRYPAASKRLAYRPVACSGLERQPSCGWQPRRLSLFDSIGAAATLVQSDLVVLLRPTPSTGSGVAAETHVLMRMRGPPRSAHGYA
jgi:hypothetical protein